MKNVVFDRKNGHVGIKRLATQKEEKTFFCNYVVDVLDPVMFGVTTTVTAISGNEYDWQSLPINDPRVQYVNLFDVIESADWYHHTTAHDESAIVDEAYIENTHEVFDRIRKIFKT